MVVSVFVGQGELWVLILCHFPQMSCLSSDNWQHSFWQNFGKNVEQTTLIFLVGTENSITTMEKNLSVSYKHILHDATIIYTYIFTPSPTEDMSTKSFVQECS